MSSNNFQTGSIEGSKGLLAMSATSTSPPDPSMYPWNWCDGAGAIDLSPASSVSSSNDSPDFRRDLKRGRPRADAITTLIVEGTRVNSDIRCKICNRVFPRDKSLQAHMRTHTGERPYRCDYPGCDKSFCQSGQLKTHQRLHTGEKPFLCSVPGCTSRFAHANRHCTDHPRATLRRDHASNFTPSKTEQSPEVQFWLDRHLQKRQERTPNRPPRSRATKRSLNLHHNEENQPTSLDAKQLQFSSPPPKKLGTEFHHSRESVIKQPKPDKHDLKWEYNDMGVRRLQPLQTTPLKTSHSTRHLTPLQNVPLNLASPVEVNSVQQDKTLPLPLVPQRLTVLENAPKNTSNAVEILSFQNRSIPYLPGSGVPDICNELVPSTSKLEHIESCFTTPPRRILKRTTEERDMLIGALALVELSQSPQ